MRWLILGIGLLTCSVNAAEYLAARAHSNYQIYCQGCHGPDGSGAGDVPRMLGHVGSFQLSAAGREYVVRVPGSATSALSNERLAEVLNWIVYEFSGDSFVAAFEPYTAEEVGRLRASPLNETVNTRAAILAELAAREELDQGDDQR